MDLKTKIDYLSDIYPSSCCPEFGAHIKNPDVEIADDEAVLPKFIERIELGDEEVNVADAIKKLKILKTYIEIY